eukprot:m.237718 g.237718  ORF g.237718 m.237718 type:complete len:75 (-) comp21329_c0_seq1:394-618(-)
MIPLLTRAFLTRGTRWVFLPLAMVVGFVGAEAQQYFQKAKNEQDNKDFPAAWERREQRQMQEFEASSVGKPNSN